MLRGRWLLSMASAGGSDSGWLSIEMRAEVVGRAVRTVAGPGKSGKGRSAGERWLCFVSRSARQTTSFRFSDAPERFFADLNGFDWVCFRVCEQGAAWEGQSRQNLRVDASAGFHEHSRRAFRIWGGISSVASEPASGPGAGAARSRGMLSLPRRCRTERTGAQRADQHRAKLQLKWIERKRPPPVFFPRGAALVDRTERWIRACGPSWLSSSEGILRCARRARCAAAPLRRRSARSRRCRKSSWGCWS